MVKWLVLVALIFPAVVRAGALEELKAQAGPLDISIPVPRVPGPLDPEAPTFLVPVRTTSESPNASFPISKEGIEAASRRVDGRAYVSYSCEYFAGEPAARCTFFYDADPAVSDYAVAEVDVRTPERVRILTREWRR